jgi:hypothetical protein
MGTSIPTLRNRVLLFQGGLVLSDYPKDRGSSLFLNFGTYIPIYTMSHPKRRKYSSLLLQKHHISKFYCNFVYILHGVVKSRRLRWMGHAARVGIREMHTGFWLRNSKDRIHFKDPEVDGRIILKLILKLWNGKARIGLICVIKRTRGRIIWTT